MGQDGAEGAVTTEEDHLPFMIFVVKDYFCFRYGIRHEEVYGKLENLTW